MAYFFQNFGCRCRTQPRKIATANAASIEVDLRERESERELLDAGEEQGRWRIEKERSREVDNKDWSSDRGVVREEQGDGEEAVKWMA